MNFTSQYSISSEDISTRSTVNEYRTQSFPRSSTRESSFFRPSAPTLSTVSTSSESDIYTISQSKPESNGNNPRVLRRHRVNFRCRPTIYKRHTNLDSKPLTWNEKLNLARIHYVNFPNIARLVCVLLCLAWFIFVGKCNYFSYIHYLFFMFLFSAYNTLKDYKQHNTTVHLSFENPKKSFPPSLTICTHNLLEQFVC